MIGQVLQERFRIDAHIGRWCGSEVYRAMDLQRRQPVLVRLLAEAYAGSESLWAQLAARAQQMTTLSHPGILHLQSLGRDGNTVYLVYDYAQATPLAEMWQPDGASPTRAQILTYIRQLAEALDAMHQAGMAHGGLCPLCVLVDVNSGALLLDGMAAAALLGADQAVRETVALYAAPEQVGPQAASPAADRYALAALAFEWLTGRSPHVAQGAAALPYEQQAAMTAPSATRLNPALPRAVDGAFAVLLSPDPQKRPASALAVAERLAHALQSQGDSSGQRGLHWLWGFIGVVLTLCLVVGAIWAVSRHGRDAGAGDADEPDGQGLVPVATLPTTQPTPTFTLMPTATLPEPTDTPLATPTEQTADALATATEEPTRQPTMPVTTVPTTPPAPVPTTDASAAAPTCAVTLSGPFATLWETYRGVLGCPLDSEPIAGLWAEQPFENGHMYWSEDADLFLVTVGDGVGTWLALPDDETAWQEDMPKKTCDLEEPSGLDLPERGFGYIWCTDDALRSNLGWGTDTERGFGGGLVLLQRFENGYIFRSSDGNTTGEAYVLSTATGTYVRTAY